jgi:hypothetical protein
MDMGGRANTNMSRPDSTFGHTKAPTSVRQGLKWFRGNLNLGLAIVRLGVVKPTVVAIHVLFTFIALISKLNRVTTHVLFIDNRIIRVSANYRH